MRNGLFQVTRACVPLLRRADDRGVACDVLHFGQPIVTLRHGRTVGHDSTRGVVYRRHQARHLAVVAESVDVVWAVAVQQLVGDLPAGRPGAGGAKAGDGRGGRSAAGG